MNRLSALALAFLACCSAAHGQDRPTIPPVAARPTQQGQISQPFGKRVALVIGNAAYVNTAPLANPRNDAADIAAVLRKLSFLVTEGKDLDKAGMDRTIRDFANSLSGATTALFYYAGHGLQVGGQNYLVPIDAQLSTAAALDFEMVRLDLIQRTMERETTTNVLILDACRDNPLARNLARALGTRSAQIGRGLAVAESGDGTLISFSTQPGNVALDGIGRNSPFAESLTKHIASSGEDLSSLLVSVRNDVMKATERRQVPWEHSALTSKFYFSAPKPPGPTVEQQIELAFWASVKDSADPGILQTYIKGYPHGTFKDLAIALIEQAERKVAADQAAREERRRRDEEAIKAEQLRLLEDERKQRETTMFDERQRAEEAKDREQAVLLRKKQETELAARTEELRKLQEDVRAARTAASAAEALRKAAATEAITAADAAKQARAKQATLEAAPRSAAHSETQLGGRFTVRHATQVRAHGEQHRLIIPNFAFAMPTADVPPELRRFIGIWADDGAKTSSRRVMLIVVRVDKDGNADGYWLSGPPGPKSRTQSPARTYFFQGKFTGLTLRFLSSSGTEYKFTLANSGILQGISITKSNQTDARQYQPLWHLE